MNITRTFIQYRRYFFALLMVGLTGNAMAHAGLESSIPQANSQVKMSPPELVLTFEKPIMLMKLSVADDKGKAVDLNFKVSSDTTPVHKYPLPALGNGIYSVNWSAMGQEGHTMNGAFTFTVGAIAKESSSTKPDEMKNHDGMDMDHSGHKK